MERNIDKIKRLEHEIGRYQKKVADQTKLIQSLHNDLMDERNGKWEIRAAADAVLTAVTLGYGVQAEDPDEPGKYIGWRLAVQDVIAEEMREKYEFRAVRNDKKNSYLLVVMPREAADAPHNIKISEVW